MIEAAMRAAGPYNWPLGWIPTDNRTRDQESIHQAVVATMPESFRLQGAEPDAGPIVSLIELWRHDWAKAAIGFEFPGVRQLTGSCVGTAGGNVGFTLSCVELIRLQDLDQIIIPFWLFPYGKSRELLGERSEGEGSLGSTFAKAAQTFGWFGQQEEGLEPYSEQDGLIWGEKVELKWSNGVAIPQKYLEIGKKHLVRTVSPIQRGADARPSIRNLYPITFACNWFINPGTERVRGSGANACVVGTLNGRGGHQTSLLAQWDHPELGPLYWNQNQWGRNVYKKDPTIGLGSGCWMEEREIDRAIQSGDAEVYAFSQHEGYPSQNFTSWVDIIPRVKSTTSFFLPEGQS